MRIRTIKPEFWSSAKMARVPREVRLLFIGLWNEADDEGRLLGSPKRLAGSLFEHDDDVDVPMMEGWLSKLEGAGLVIRYEVKGTAYVAIPGFGEHQRIDKRWASRLPPPPEDGSPPSLAQPPASLAEHCASPAQLCAPDMILSGNDLLSEMGGGSELAPEAPPPAPPPPASPAPPESPADRLESRERGKVIGDARRDRAGRRASSEAVWGRPQTPEALLALPVAGDPPSACDPEHPKAKPIGDIWRSRWPCLDGRSGRPTLAEVVALLWDYAAQRPWGTGGASVLSWWAVRLGEESRKHAKSWEADGGAGAASPERLALRREYHRLEGLGRDLPPFETWADLPPDARGRGADPAGGIRASGGSPPSGRPRPTPIPEKPEPTAATKAAAAKALAEMKARAAGPLEVPRANH